MLLYLKQTTARYKKINIFKTFARVKFPSMEAKHEKEEKKEKKPQSTARRDRLIELEKQAQELWAASNFFEANPSENPLKYFLTFPYPYVNGKLHLGHAFSFTKCEFTARYKKLMGYNVLFPFSFHCTGMPISAAAQKLNDEITQYGEGKIPDKVGDKMTQYNILKMSGVDQEEIKKFVDPLYWLKYFPPVGKTDLKAFGGAIDWRRSFITTSMNPYYNSFIEWQFTKLKEQNLIVFGKRPSIYSIKDKQMIADHDRSEGEGVGPQEYTLIKLRVMEPFTPALAKLEGHKVFLVAATLRPETMYGQTNCFILPTGVYGAFLMKNDEIFICSERSAWNMAFQNLTKVPEQITKIVDIVGQDLIGLPLKAPLAIFEKVYSLPMLTISMAKGTGVVTSVPSDAPDDFAALRDLQKKEEFRKKFKVTEEMVIPYNPVPIINIPEYGDFAAIKACDEFKVVSQNDKELLKNAKEKVYLKGYYEGTMLVGVCKGKKVCDSKNIVRKEMIENGQAEIYYEPESLIVARSGGIFSILFIYILISNY